MSDAGDVVERAKAALMGIYDGPWINVGHGNVHVDPVGSRPPVAKAWNRAIGDFIAASPMLVTDMLAEIETLRAAVAMHQPTITETIDDRWECCESCGADWPCPTAAAIGLT